MIKYCIFSDIGESEPSSIRDTINPNELTSTTQQNSLDYCDRAFLCGVIIWHALLCYIIPSSFDTPHPLSLSSFLSNCKYSYHYITSSLTVVIIVIQSLLDIIWWLNINSKGSCDRNLFFDISLCFYLYLQFAYYLKSINSLSFPFALLQSMMMTIICKQQVDERALYILLL